MIILRWLAAVGLTGTVAAIAAYGPFRHLGGKWLDARFAKSLESFKQDQNREIERLRYRINALMDRTTRLHQYEFEVLPEIWVKLVDAFSQISRFTSRMQTHPNLETIRDAEFLEFLKESDLANWQQEELQKAKFQNRNKLYLEFIYGHDLYKAKKINNDFHNYFISKAIFIQPELKKKIHDLSDMMYEALKEKEWDQQYPMPGDREFAKRDIFHREGYNKLESIEAEVVARLWEANKLD